MIPQPAHRNCPHFGAGAGLYPADDPGFDPELPGSFDDDLSMFGREVDLQSVAHIEHLVHFPPVRTGFFPDQLE
jgi:hypothetical protein